MIDEKKLVELQRRWEVMPGTVTQEAGLEMVSTLEAALKVVMAAKDYRDCKEVCCSVADEDCPHSSRMDEALKPFAKAASEKS